MAHDRAGGGPIMTMSMMGMAVVGKQSSTSSGEWTAEEDQLVLSMIAEIGPKWSRIAKQLPGRSDSSVRNRHTRLLQLQEGEAPDKAPRDRGSELAWSPENDETLRYAFSIHGAKWGIITKTFFPERTSNAVRNRFHRSLARSSAGGAAAGSSCTAMVPSPVNDAVGVPPSALSTMLSGAPGVAPCVHR